MQISVAFDYRCGYSYKAARYLRELAKAGVAVQVDWRPFSLEQVNEEHGEGLDLWQHPEVETGSFHGLGAGAWLKAHQPEVFEAYLWRAFEIMHDDGRKLDPEAIASAAKHAGADVPALERALDSGEAARLAGDEFAALRALGVFGTPTFFFPSGEGFYVRLRGVWKDDAHRMRVWEHLAAFAAEPIVSELQRIHPPDPPAPVVMNIPG